MFIAVLSMPRSPYPMWQRILVLLFAPPHHRLLVSANGWRMGADSAGQQRDYRTRLVPPMNAGSIVTVESPANGNSLGFGQLLAKLPVQAIFRRTSQK